MHRLLKLLFFGFIPFVLPAATIANNNAPVIVKSISELQKAIDKAIPGNQIILADGTYPVNENIIIHCQGTDTNPIIIESNTIGGVKLEGKGGFILEKPATYVIIKGFVFNHNTGVTFLSEGATHCIFTRNVFECAPVNSGSKAYLTVSGDDNEISYNTFQNKTDEGQMISVQGPGKDKMAKRTWIHHNYFYNFPPKANNCSAIQIGLSWRSMDSAFCLVEHNLFIKTAGENEGCICHKSCKNTIRYNTFGPGSEEVSIRHGNGSKIYGNFFIESTGLRFSGDDHLIYSNFFKNCREAIVCTNGDGEVAEGSKLTCHDRADRVQVVYNTMVDCGSSFRQPFRKDGLGATSITFANNIIQGGNPVSIEGPFVNPVWTGNILWNTGSGAIPSAGYTLKDPKLIVDKNGIYHLSKKSPAIGAGIGAFPNVVCDIDGQKRSNIPDTGADQFSKAPVANRSLSINDVGPMAK